MSPLLSANAISVSYPIMGPAEYNLKRVIAGALLMRRTRPRVFVDALQEISFRLAEGQRLALIGSNGAGKSTLLHALGGVIVPKRGYVERRGRVMSLFGAPTEGLDVEASGLDNIKYVGLLQGETARRMAGLKDDIIDFSGLGARIADPVYTYSAGMRARLRFSILTALTPDILLLDEGISAADAEFSNRAQARLNAFSTQVPIVVVASHSPEMLKQYAREALWIEQGREQMRGETASVWQAYTAKVLKQRQD